MTSDSVLAEFIRYNNWANRVVLEACQKLTDDQLDAAAPGTYGSIRDTLGHLIRAEAWYIELMTGQRPHPPFQWEDRPGLPAITEFAAQVSDALTDAAAHVPVAQIVREEDQGKTWHYNALAVFIQIVNHGIEHRTNITTIISGLGLTSPEVDGWGYLSANPDRLGPAN